MDLIYEWTAEFKNAEKALPKEQRDRLVELINERGQLFKKQRRSFYKGMTQPVYFRLKYGAENAYYLLPFGSDWRILLAACRQVPLSAWRRGQDLRLANPRAIHRHRSTATHRLDSRTAAR